MSHHESTYLFSEPDTAPEFHATSATAYLLDELALYGHRPGPDEPDPRSLPEPDDVRSHLGAIIEAFGAMLTGTRLEEDLAVLRNNGLIETDGRGYRTAGLFRE